MYQCCECNRKFKTEKAADRAASNGCPGCGGVDIDLDPTSPGAWDPALFEKPLPPSIRTKVFGVPVDYDDPPLKRRQLAR